MLSDISTNQYIKNIGFISMAKEYEIQEILNIEQEVCVYDLVLKSREILNCFNINKYIFNITNQVVYLFKTTNQRKVHTLRSTEN